MKTLLRLWFLCFVIWSVPVSRSFAAPGWFWQNPLPQGNHLWGVSVLDANTVVAVGTFSTVIKTTDGGVTWAVQHYAGGTTDALLGVSFVGADTGTTVGSSGTILRTTDGGATWTLQTSGTPAWLYGVSFVDSNTGTAVGERGTIVRTTDGGRHLDAPD